MKHFTDFEEIFFHRRREYFFGKLDENAAAADPFIQFGKWFREAFRKKIPSRNAVTLATATKTGKPSARVVLLKGFDERGFVFCTNYQSQKGREIAENPQGELVVYWPEMERQIRVAGRIQKTSKEESAQYFQARPRDSQIAAWISDQSKIIRNRAALEVNFLKWRKKYQGKAIPLPPFWGGYRLRPQVFEFWQGRENRLNDRLRYVLRGGKWRIERLQP